LARWLPNGCVEIVGRTDDQVKIRGFRIELAEIESNLLLLPEVRQCAVIARKDNLGFYFLAAYLEVVESANITNEILSDALKEKLPDYMIPSMFMFLKTLPVTTHGKIDKKSLPEPDVRKMRQPDGYVPPSTKEERRLAKIWEEVLNISNIGTEDDFFNLGGHSLSVLQALSRINNCFGEVLSIKDFINNSTISMLAKCLISKKEMIEHNGNQKSHLLTNVSDPIIALRTDGEKTPLFLIHPVGGTIFWYIHLSKLLNTGHPIYAIQDPGIMQKNKVFQNIEDMASFYLSAIREIQPNGPYLIGGASFGSTVAIEIGKQLYITKEELVFVPALDGWAFYPDTLLDPNIFKETMERQYTALRSKFTANGITNSVQNLLKLQRSRLEMLWDYKLGKVTCPLTLFKAKKLLPVFKSIDSPSNHWDKYTTLTLDINIVPGDHETMFQTPNVQILAEKINKYLELFV